MYSSRAGWCWAPSWVVVELVVLRLVGWWLGGFCLENQSQKSPSPLVCTLCGCSVAQECVGYRPTTTQPPITAQLARRWVVLGGLKTTQTSSDLVDQARAALASSGLVWVVKKPPNTTQHHQLRPGLARTARAAWSCLYVDTNNPNRPAQQLVRAAGRPGRDQVHQVKGYAHHLVKSIWPQYVSAWS